MLSQFRRPAVAAGAILACFATAAAYGAAVNHGDFGEQTSSKTCLACHGKADVIQTTARLNPNPHDSHRGFVECMECHSFAKDKPAILMCNDCHAFETKDGFHIISRPAK